MSWRSRVAAGTSVLVLSSISAVSFAQQAAPGAQPAQPAQPAAGQPGGAQPAAAQSGTSQPAVDATPDGIRRDPQGVTGISPFWEAVREGDRAYVARSWPAAIEAYKKAIAAQPNNPMGHYRLGQAHMANSQIREAEKAYVAALRYAANDPHMKAKVLFVIADLRERQRDNNGAVERWDAYAAHLGQTQVHGYPGTAEERKKVNARWQELKTQYAEVKQRIAKREEEADESLKKGAK